jgi:hypothetical protein
LIQRRNLVVVVDVGVDAIEQGTRAVLLTGESTEAKTDVVLECLYHLQDAGLERLPREDLGRWIGREHAS